MLASLGLDDYSWVNIRLYSNAGELKGEFTMDEAGFADACAYSVENDLIHVPPCTITGDHVIREGVHVRGSSQATVTFTGMITAMHGSNIEDITIHHTLTPGASYGMCAFIFVGAVRIKRVTIRNIRADNYNYAAAIKSGAPGSSLRARDCTFYSSGDCFWSRTDLAIKESEYIMGSPEHYDYVGQTYGPVYGSEGFGPGGVSINGVSAWERGYTANPDIVFRPVGWGVSRIKLNIDLSPYINPCMSVLYYCPKTFEDSINRADWKILNHYLNAYDGYNYNNVLSFLSLYNIYSFQTNVTPRYSVPDFVPNPEWYPSFADSGTGVSGSVPVYNSQLRWTYLPQGGHPVFYGVINHPESNTGESNRQDIPFIHHYENSSVYLADGHGIPDPTGDMYFGFKEPYNRIQHNFTIGRISIYSGAGLYYYQGVHRQETVIFDAGWQCQYESAPTVSYGLYDMENLLPDETNPNCLWSDNHFFNCKFVSGAGHLDMIAYGGTKCWVQDCSYSNISGDVRISQEDYRGTAW
jgi:hypothetical protein